MNFRTSFRAALVSASILIAGQAGNAHGVVLPGARVPHFLVPHVFLKSTVRSNLLFSTRVPGLSGSASSLLNLKKSVVVNGINLGTQTALQRQTGNILNGQLSGTLYENFSGPTSPYLAYGPNYILAFGNNPLYNPYPNPQFPAPTTVISNFIKFVSPNGKSVSGKVIGGGVASLAQQSGSERAFQNQLKLITGKAVNYGESVGNSPIVGGEFFGTNYYSYSSSLVFTRNTAFVYAFGNDPFNTGTFATTSITNPGNFIRLANGKVFTYGSGLLNATGYSKLFPNINWIFAIGKSPYNLSPFLSNPATLTFSKSPGSFLNF